MAIKDGGGDGGPGAFETIEPLEVRLAGQGASPGPPRPPRNRAALVAAGAAALLLAALGLWLIAADGGEAPPQPGENAQAGPSGVSRPSEPPRPSSGAAPGAAAAGKSRAAAGSAAGNATGSAVPPSQLPPYAKAQLSRQRAGARNQLGDLVAAQEALAEMAVDRWGGADFESAREAAAEGDRLFAAGDYPAAEARYARAFAAVKALLARAPQVARDAAQSGWQALAAQDAKAAQAHFQLALAVADGLQRAAASGAVPETAAAGAAGNAAAGLARAQALPQVLELLQAGQALAAQGDLQGARQRFSEARKLDGENAAARAALAQVQRRIAKRGFGQAMSRGLLALNAGDFSAARAAFNRAAKLAPASREPADGLRRVAAAEALVRIRALQQRAEAAEAKEQWPQAEAHYRALLALDASLVLAQQGAARSGARAGLDSQLRALLADPWKLAEDAVHRGALDLRSRAGALQPRGPRLAAQLSQLDRVLKLARTPLPVRITSDAETAVRLHRVGDLGRFASKDLQLRPGRYTLQGTRRGYRDVLRSFVLEPGSPQPTVHIHCAEKI